MAEAGSESILTVANLTSKDKIVVVQASPISTTDTITLNATNFTGLAGYNAIVTAWAVESSGNLTKNIGTNGSTILTTIGWTAGEGPWYVTILLRNDAGQIGNA